MGPGMFDDAWNALIGIVIVVIILFCFFGIVLGGCTFSYLSKNNSNIEWQNEAVKHKAAEFYLDKDNNKKFRWNDEKEGEL